MDIKYFLQKAFQKVFCKPIVRSSKISKKAAVWNNSLIINSEINDYSYVSDHTSIYYTKIGKFCSISSYCAIGGASHPIDFVSTSPVFLEGRNAMNTHFAKLPYKPYKKTQIGNDVWIGTHCCIKSGISIGDGSVVGMGSVVIKDIGSYEIWAGNPARFIRKRFKNEDIVELQKYQWWNMNDEEINMVAYNMNNINLFLKNSRIESRKKNNGKI